MKKDGLDRLRPRYYRLAHRARLWKQVAQRSSHVWFIGWLTAQLAAWYGRRWVAIDTERERLLTRRETER